MADIEDLFDCFEQTDDVEVKEETDNKVEVDENNESSGLNNSKRKIEDPESEPAETEPKKLKTCEVDFDDIDFEEFKNRIVVHTINTESSCTHEVAFPPGQPFTSLQNREGEPEKEYAFKLDPFQEESIKCVDNNQSVLVSAHTSAGKTVIAEYAVAKSLKNKQRVIYTTPIKALSNQKYREFLEEFKDVGLVTGDVTINPSASCLIMTTEILRNMLYRGSEIMREVGWVIFDEIHYMRDKERGVVWEETLILLPHNVHFVFLSATIPNARQFAEWVAHLHKQPCHVVYTDYRPTPLQHFIYPAGGNGIHMVVDETGVFKDDSFNAAMMVLQNGDGAKGDQKGRNGGMVKDPANTDIFKVVKMIMDRGFSPVIVFSFSKKECELHATQMMKLDFNSTAEKQLVDEVFNNAMDVLSEEDRNLPQVQNILPLLRRGIGIHHGGLLPILKETIEIMFGEGLIKALFATETFAMGLNMPARTVLFTGMKKFDGKEMRWITSGEYIQMSGRAGRRGLDDKGIVILMVDEKVPPAAGREIVKGLPDPINSAFHLTYNMVLNLLRVEEINPEYMLERSFFQFQNQTNIPLLRDDYLQKLDDYNALQIENEEQIASYHKIRQELDTLATEFRVYLTQPMHLIPFLQPGRLVKVKINGHEFDWAVIIAHKKKHEFEKSANKKKTKAKTVVEIELMVHCSRLKSDTESEEGTPIPGTETEGEPTIIKLDSKYITHISQIRLFCPPDLRKLDSRKAFQMAIKEVEKRFPESIPLLDPVKDMKIKDDKFLDILGKIKKLEKALFEHPLHNHDLLNTEYSKYEQKLVVEAALSEAKKKLLEAKSLLHLDELKCRKRVLRRLGYCTTTDVIQLKGRVACELSSADELLITEMLFNGLFGSLTAQQATALLSCFVCDERVNESPKLSEDLSGPLRQMQDLARRIAKVSNEARLPVDEDQYVEQFKPYMMDLVFSWCNGASFSDLCTMTEIFEGSIVRCMRRLEELLRQMVQASKTIGNVELEDKFNHAIRIIKRDIVFSSSLYL